MDRVDEALFEGATANGSCPLAPYDAGACLIDESTYSIHIRLVFFKNPQEIYALLY
jgi:hypothetical protein